MRHVLFFAALFTASTLPAAQDQDNLAARVKAGEGWGTSAITTGEITACWATWKALREHVAQSGQGSFPADYTVANLDWRVADWTRALDRAFANRPEDRVPEGNQELQSARAEMAWPKIAARAERSGNCKKLPEGIQASAAPKSAVAQAKASAPAAAAPAGSADRPALAVASAGASGVEAFDKGVAHRDGVGRPVNRAAAYYWFLRAAMAQAPHPEAARKLAALRDLGPMESPEGAALFQQAENLVLHANTDQELKANKPKSFALHLQAAELGHLPSINTMMTAYREKGWGTEPDIVKSREWAQISAEFGDREGERVLAAYMLGGIGGPRNTQGARFWYEKSALQGNAQSMMALARIYDGEAGLPPNEALAIYWYKEAYKKKWFGAEQALLARGLLQPDPVSTAFIQRIDSQGPDRSSLSAFTFDVAQYCKYGGSRCTALSIEAVKMEREHNTGVASANTARLWNVYSKPGESDAAWRAPQSVHEPENRVDPAAHLWTTGLVLFGLLLLT